MLIYRRDLLLLLAAPVIFIILFFIIPFGILLIDSFRSSSGFGFEQYAKLTDGWYYFETLLLTFRISIWVTLSSFVIGYPLAYFMTRVIKLRWLRRLMYVLVITPLFTSNIVRSFGWMILLGRKGMVNESLLSVGVIEKPLMLLSNEISVVIGMTYIMTPFMVLTIAAVLQKIDTNLEHAARDLGANPLVTFIKITFPLSFSGVVAGSLIVFTLSVSAYVTPSILSGGKQTVMSMLIYQHYTTLFDYNFGAALSALLLLTTLALIGLSKMISLKNKKT